MSESDDLPSPSSLSDFAGAYLVRLKQSCDLYPLEKIELLGHAGIAGEDKQVFIFGNGGSAGNAMHLANDLLYGVAKRFGSGIRVTALPANSSVVTCLANDQGYDAIFSHQLAVLAGPGDLALALSGSGNSRNVVNALKHAKTAGLQSFAILGYSGGECLSIADHAIHIPVNDMQLSEDAQIVIGHLLMQWLYANDCGES